MKNIAENELEKMFKKSLFPSVYMTLICIAPIIEILIKLYDKEIIMISDYFLLFMALSILVLNWAVFYFEKKNLKKKYNLLIGEGELTEQEIDFFFKIPIFPFVYYTIVSFIPIIYSIFQLFNKDMKSLNPILLVGSICYLIAAWFVYFTSKKNAKAVFNSFNNHYSNID